MDATDKLENCESHLRLQQKPQRPGSRAFASSATPWIPRRGWCRRACLARWDTHRGIFLATERARKQIKLKKGEENTKNVKRWGWTPVGSGLGIYFLVNTWMNGWNTFIILYLWMIKSSSEWTEMWDFPHFPAICGVVSYENLDRQVQFGDETLKYLPSWASTKPRGYVATWPICSWRDGTGGMGFLVTQSAAEAMKGKGNVMTHLLQLCWQRHKDLNWWKAEMIRSNHR